ncbi:MAG: NAD-dependent epimerase/dehydratase family protein, partial [Myxococcota bacterium]|nr:NAD-dependent epimerase/dehydratase family protein [Myxococcota bacterium]
MKVLVTGGAGFVGSVLVRQLLSDGHEVRVVDNLSYGGQSMLPLFIDPRFSLVEADVLDVPQMRSQLEGVDAVVHLAALVGYPLCKKMPERAWQVNVEGTRILLDHLPEHARFVFASTGSNYGEVTGLCTEDTPLNPLSIYGETKTRAEELVL